MLVVHTQRERPELFSDGDEEGARAVFDGDKRLPDDAEGAVDLLAAYDVGFNEAAARSWEVAHRGGRQAALAELDELLAATESEQVEAQGDEQVEALQGALAEAHAEIAALKAARDVPAGVVRRDEIRLVAPGKHST